MSSEKPSRAEIFDALVYGDSSTEGCDPDWTYDILSNADPKDLAEIQAAISHPERTERETEYVLFGRGYRRE